MFRVDFHSLVSERVWLGPSGSGAVGVGRVTGRMCDHRVAHWRTEWHPIGPTSPSGIEGDTGAGTNRDEESQAL